MSSGTSTALHPRIDDPSSVEVPDGWKVLKICDLYEQLPTGPKQSSKTATESGTVPIVDQSADGILGYHDGDPGVMASTDRPVVTFANHTCAMRLHEEPFSVIQNVFPKIGKPGVCTTRYLLYATDRRQTIEEYKGHHPQWRESFVQVPALPEQRRIAWVLGSLDDKIELNKRMARTLEDIAAAIFRARFVDFEGVEDFEDSAPGPIPKGWKWGELDEIVTSTNERESADEAVADAPYLGLDVMPRASTVLWAWDERSKVSGETRKFLPGDILFGKLRPYFKKVGVAPVAGSCSTEILVLRPDEDYWSVALGHLTDDRFIEHCVAHSRGTRMPRSEWKDMKAYPVPIPPSENAAVMGAPIEVIYQQVERLVHETRTLSGLRDELLPRLISGQIRVPEGVGPDVDATEVAGKLVEA